MLCFTYIKSPCFPGEWTLLIFQEFYKEKSCDLTLSLLISEYNDLMEGLY